MRLAMYLYAPAARGRSGAGPSTGTRSTGNLNLPLVYKEEHGAFCRKVLANLDMY